LGLILAAVLLAKKHRLFSFCILWFFGNLLIESSFLGIELIYEHRLYLPSMLAISALICLLWKLLKPNLLKAAVFSILALLLLSATYIRNKVWADEITLWQDCVAKSPTKWRPNHNLATTIYNKATSIYNNYNKQECQQAIDFYNKAILIDPCNFESYEGLGFAYQALNKYKEALDYTNKSLAINPKAAKSYYVKGQALYRLNQPDQAIENFNKSIELNASFDKMYNDLAVIYYGRRQTEKAIYYWETAIRLNPDQAESLNNLAFLLSTSPDKNIFNPAEGLRLAQKANEVTKYKNPDLLDTLAAAYAANGQFDSAIQTAQKAIALAEAKGNNQLIGEIKNRLRLYESSQPFIEQYEKSENTNSKLQEKQ
jgi:tetratricopeptide (TPR) repeat protein